MSEKRTWRGRLARAALGLLLVVVLAAALAHWALRTERGQRFLLTRLSDWTLSELGFAVDAESLRLSPGSGTLEVAGLRLTAGDGPPFVTAQTVRSRVVVRSLLRRPTVIESLEIDELTVDLEAPLPEADPTDPEAPRATELPVHIGRLALSSASVRGGAVADRLSSWLLEDLALEAAFDGRRLRIVELLGAARFSLAASDRSPISALLAGQGDLSLDGTAAIERFDVSGKAFTLDVSGDFGPALADNRASFTIKADPGEWLRDRPSGPVVFSGELDLGAWTGEVRLDSDDQPADLLVSLLPAGDAERYELDSSSLRLAGNLRLGPERSIAGDLELGLLRDKTRIATVLLRPDLELAGDLPLAASFEMAILPQDPGLRIVSGRLRAPAAARLADWRIEDGSSTLKLPSADRALGRIARLYPRLLAPGRLADLPALGQLELAGRFSGALEDPDLLLKAELRPPGGGRAALTLDGRPLSGQLVAQTRGNGIELGGLYPALSGRLEWSGAVERPLTGPRGRLELGLRELETSEGRLLDELDLVLAGDAEEIDWRLGAASGLRRLSGDGSIGPTPPIRRARGDLVLSTGDPRLPRFETSFTLDAGTLDARIEARPGGGETASLRARLPLATVSSFPRFAGVGQLPIEKAGGEVELEWEVATGEWDQFLPPALTERVSRLRGGTSGRLALDPDCLTCARGLARLSALELEVDDRRVSAAQDLVLELESKKLTVAPWMLSGDGFRLEIGGATDLAADWRLGEAVAGLATHLEGFLTADIESGWLESLPIDVTRPGALGIEASISGPPGALTGEARLDAADLALSPRAAPDLILSRPSARFTVVDGYLEWSELAVDTADGRIASSGRARLDDPLREASGRVDLATGLPVFEGATLPFLLEEGVLRVDRGVLETTGGPGALRLELPIDQRTGSALLLDWDLPANDWTPLLRRLGKSDDPEVLQAASRGSLELPLDEPARARASVLLEQARIRVRGRETRLEPRVEITAADGLVTVAPFELRSGSQTFSFRATTRLAPEWRAGDPPATLLTSFEILGSGGLDAGLLNPWLAGGRGEGPLDLEIALQGSADDYDGRLVVDGPEASILFRGSYLARFQSPQLVFQIKDGRVVLETGRARLNEGPMLVSGLVWDGTQTDLRAEVSEALFRLDYGLLATLGADLRFQFDTGGTAALTGSIDVDRGSLTRDLQLDYDFLSEFLAPVDLTTTEEGITDLVELDLSVRTRAGVRVKNNLADLLVRWEPLAVTGSLARPVLEGRLEADPGGLLHLYGQTVRLDQAAIEYPGIEDQEARLDLEVTTSLEDPTIGRLEGRDPFRTASQSETSGADSTADVGADLARYWGEQFAGRVGEAVGFKVSLRPLLIFGETDPGARLTVSHDLSPQLAIAASVNLREAEGQTYLLEVHELGRLPQLVAQAFTDDQSTYGGVLLQRRELGGSVAADDAGLPRVRKIAVQPPPAVSRRGIRRAIGLAKGDPFDAESRFAAEVELADYLLRKGYADARVSLRAIPVPNRPQRVDLEVALRPGPRALFEFEGEKLNKALRGLISDLYRPDFFEAESILEMRAEAIRALRSRGFLVPEVEIRVEPIDPADPAGDRRVLVSTTGGEKLSPAPPVFLGLPPEDAAALAAPFFNTVQRVELAVGLESADRRLLRALADRGYPEARIVRRYQGLKDRALTVEIEPGPRRRIASVEITFSTDEENPLPEAATPWVTVTAGDPLLRRDLSRSALALERELGSRGYLDARVLTHLEPDEADPTAVAVRFDVLPGAVSRLAAIEFTGLAATKESWARKATGLDIGRALERDGLARARTALWRTGLFSAVFAETQEVEPGLRKAIFDLTERPRYRLSYGVRWDSEAGVGVVLDASDDNFRGRGWTLGLRALDSSDEKSLRLLTRIPRAFGGPGSFELFAGASEITEPFFDRFGSTEVIAEILEGTVQYSHPLSPRTTLRLYARHTDTKRDLPFLTVRIKNPQLGFQYLYDSRSTEPLTRRGTFASVDFSTSDDFLGGDLSYARLFSQISHHRPAAKLGGRRLTWSQSLRAGLAEAFDDQRLIRDVLFFAGGEYSVRGYETESLGELAQFGSVVEAVGGAALLVVNQELRWSFLEDYTAIAFVDAGNVWSSIDDFGLDLVTSAGVGLRAVTPVGLLRLDLAHALDRRPEIDPEFKLYFGLGTTF